jgi:hypothetical protein
MVDELAVPGAVIAEKGPDFERAIGEERGTRNRPPVGEVERADDDLVVGELDKDGHGTGTGTFVAKGDPIPAGLAELPRRPARPAPSRKR